MSKAKLVQLFHGEGTKAQPISSIVNYRGSVVGIIVVGVSLV